MDELLKMTSNPIRIIPREGVDNTPLVINTPNCRFTEYNYIEVSYDNTTGRPQPARYNSQQKASIVDVPSNYKLSAVRVEVDLDFIPMFSSADKTLEVRMTFDDSGTLITAQQQLFTIPVTVWSTQQVVQELNTALQLAFLSLVSQYEVINGPGSWTGDASLAQNQPFMKYDTPLFTLYNDYRNSDDSSNTPVTLLFSRDLTVLFSGLDYQLGTQASVISSSFTEVLFPAGPALINYVDLQSPQVADTYVVNKQAYDSSEAWYDVDRIVLLTSSIPIRQQSIASATQDGSNIQYSIITDFGLLINNTTSNPTTKFRYLPSAQYRWIDLIGDTPLKNITLSLGYADNEGAVNPVYVRPGGSFNALLLFAKTSTN